MPVEASLAAWPPPPFSMLAPDPPPKSTVASELLGCPFEPPAPDGVSSVIRPPHATSNTTTPTPSDRHPFTMKVGKHDLFRE
jgi:hypothetical protein